MSDNQDFFASELIASQKISNKRMFIVICCLIAAIASIVLGFLWYLNQYDFTSYDSSTTTASGVYAVVDSDGNVIASDLTNEEIISIMEAVTYGEGENNQDAGPSED